MNRKTLTLLLGLLVAGPLLAQQTVDNSTALWTIPWPLVTAFPGTCNLGEVIEFRNLTIGNNIYICGTTNNWVLFGVSLGGAVWGAITGTLMDQTDLVAALAAKVSAALVTTVGNPGLNTNVPTEEAVRTALAAVTVSWGAVTGTLSNQTDLATALAGKPTAALVTSVGSPGLNTNVPSEEAVATALATKPTAGLVTTVGSPGLDTNVPSEKAVRTALGGPFFQSIEYDFCTKDTVQGNYANSGARFVGLTITGTLDDNPCFYSFPSSGAGYAVIHHFLPPSWSSTAGMNFSFVWNQTSGGSGNVQWNVATACIAAGTPIYNQAVTFNAAQTQDGGYHRRGWDGCHDVYWSNSDRVRGERLLVCSAPKHCFRFRWDHLH
jgi:hypothetical protein